MPIPIDHPLVLESVTGIRKRALVLAQQINESTGMKLSLDAEMELANRLGNHVLGEEWPAAQRFYQTVDQLPN